MFGRKKIAIPEELYLKVRSLAAARGYSSPNEFVLHLLERETAGTGDREGPGEEEVKRRLRGLGYME